MEKNKKKFVVAAVAPIFILAGLLLYISPFSTGADSGPTAEQHWANNSSEASMHGNGRGAGASSHGGSSVTNQGEKGAAFASPHESWNKSGNEGSIRGKGRGRFSFQGDSGVTARRGRGKGYSSSQNNNGSASSQYENQESASQQRGHGRGTGNQSIPQNFSIPNS